MEKVLSMKILYIAFSCSPINGSEDAIGWNIPWNSAKKNEVYVITKQSHKETIEKYIGETEKRNISFYFVEEPQIAKRLNGFAFSIRLNLWHKRAEKIARLICKSKRIDVIHQITPIEFRSIGNYGGIEGCHFVVGPIGGAEVIPNGLKGYAQEHWLIEQIRNVINHIAKYEILMARALQHCDRVFFANRETMSFLTIKDGYILPEIAVTVGGVLSK